MIETWGTMDDRARRRAVAELLGRGMTFEAAGAALGVSHQTVRRWSEPGDRVSAAGGRPFVPQAELAARNAEILRRAKDGQSGPVIAAALGMTQSAVSGVLHRARERGDAAARCHAGQFGRKAPPEMRDAVLDGARAGLSAAALAERLGLSIGQVRGVIERHWPAGVRRPGAKGSRAAGKAGGTSKGLGRVLPKRAAPDGVGTLSAKPAPSVWQGVAGLRRAAEAPDPACAVALIDRRADQCAWILDARGAGGLAMVCGGETEAAGSWCAWHARRVYIQPEDRAKAVVAIEAAANAAVKARDLAAVPA